MPAIYQVDAFAEQPFTGNPAAVCLLGEQAGEAMPSDEWMQHVAAEMNLAETAFVSRIAGGFNLRWMTPKLEVDLCGHATLAAAHILWQYEHVPSSEAISFFTRSGTLSAVRRDQGIELDFPAKPATAQTPTSHLLDALSLTAGDIRFAGRNAFDWLLEVPTAAAVRALNPDFRCLGQVDVRGIMVTARDIDGEFDFISRFFAPAAGIDEDPVTGSAHVCLGPYWQARLGKNSLRAYQASARGGIVDVCVQGDRVRLTGNAQTILAGELTC